MRLAGIVFIVSVGLSLSVQVTAQEAAAIDTKEMARQSYEAFLTLAASDDARRPGALRRLADMELERAESLLIDGDSDAEARTLFANAVRRYQELLAAYPDDDNSDTVFYQMARALEALGEAERARGVLTTLVENYPNSAFTEESEFRQAETLFSAGEYQLAADAYARVIAWGEDGKSAKAFLEQSWYKHGWAGFKLSDFDISQSSFLKLLRHSLLVNGQFDHSRHDALSPGEQEMLADAMRAMSLGFSYGDGVADLGVLLDRDTAPGFEHLLFEDLGNLYRREERFHDAAQTYRAYVARYPNADYAPHMQLAVIATYEEAGFTGRALQAKEEFALEYALDRTDENFWSDHDPASAADVVAALKLHLTELSRHYHAQAQQEKSPQSFVTAATWYRAWLGSFPAAPESPETHFLLAELLYDGQSFADAVDAYEYTAYQYDTHQRSAEAGYAALLAYKHHATVLHDENLQAWNRRALDSALKFAGTFPNHEYATRVQTDAAERLFSRGELDDALAAASALLAWQPPATTAEQYTAWLVSGHAHFDKQDYLLAEKSYQEALKRDTSGDPTVIVERISASVYQQAEANLAAGELQSAVDDFLRIAQVAPTSPLVAAAQYEAASALMDLKNFTRAATVLEAFRLRYPAHELQGEVTRNLSVSYLQTGDNDKAAAELMRLASDPLTDKELRIQANMQAVQLYKETQNIQLLLTSYVHLVDTLGLPLDEDIDAREEIAGIFQKMGNESQYLYWVESIITAYQRAGPAATPRSRTAAAQATLKFAEQTWQPFVAVRLVEPLQDNLTLKKQRMEVLLQKYGQAIDYNIGPVTTAATYRIATAYAEMADALMTSQRPGDLSVEELEQYEFLLEEQAFPFEEQAIEVHENNIGRIADGIYDRWMRKSFTALADLMPGRYQKIEKGVSIAGLLDE